MNIKIGTFKKIFCKLICILPLPVETSQKNDCDCFRKVIMNVFESHQKRTHAS